MHIGFVLPGVHGHLNPGTTLASAVKARGHKVTVLSPLAGRVFADREGVGFYEIESFPRGQKLGNDLGKQSGLEAFQTTAEIVYMMTLSCIKDLPTAVDELGLDALVIDELFYLAGTSVAEMKGIPCSTIANAMTLMHVSDVPPFITTWGYSDTWWSSMRNSIYWFYLSLVCKSSRASVNEWRERNGLKPILGTQRNSGLIQLAQQPAFFDFPRSRTVLPGHFFYTSPWHRPLARDADIDFPFYRLQSGKKLIYASMGTIQNQLHAVCRNICKACIGMEDTVQLIITLGAHGANLGLSKKDDVPENCIQVDFAPQLRLLQKVDAVITHCGMNTCLETIACGLPAIAIPVANDQPGVAARWHSLGAAFLIDSPAQATVDRVRRGILEVIPDSSSYRIAAGVLKSRLEKEGLGLDKAAELLEVALKQKSPLQRYDPKVKQILGADAVVEPIMR